MSDLWTEKYRPKSINDYVWRDEKQKKQVMKWIKEKNIPHLLLTGTQGIGKSSLINVLLHEMGTGRGDVLKMNASEENSINDIRDKVLPFANTLSFGEYKIVILEEVDGMSGAGTGQQALKRIMEDYADNCRFILTTNRPNKILPAISSRCQTFHMTTLDQEQFKLRIVEILVAENVSATEDLLDNYIAITYPDLRKAINSIQMNCINGELHPPSNDSGSREEWMYKTIELVKTGKLLEAREYLCANITDTDYEAVYRFMYENLELWGDSTQQKEDAIETIRTGIVDDSMVADREINLAAVMVGLSRIKNKG